MNYSTLLIFGALINLLAGSMLIVLFSNNFGFFGLASSAAFMAIVFFKDVVNN
jgi:Mg2+/Co2+ transporter CorB